MKRQSKPALLAGLVAAVASLSTAGCYDYLERSDTIELGVANATETNKAVQQTTRWPAASRENRWQTDGERSRMAIERYRSDKIKDPSSLGQKPADIGSQATENAVKN
jgi:ABC-type uncharacterized transport system auxiliary subunit